VGRAQKTFCRSVQKTIRLATKHGFTVHSSSWAEAMTTYRAYILKADGHFKDVEELECQSDDQALQAAYRLNTEHGFDLWLGARHIALVRTPQRTDIAA
jgi:hypothetical protein